ncbi:MAG: 50S ribosomal protein L3 [Planctomycetes bacterium ADurb.Bin126]|nr:MAG: 50S ribosomal protein L3 [Planctomycetes bacterium ADurb.Bin126]HOD79834.1 50S ribosomal protein L3 [Phycisphaerae bacterium]HQL72842.1 50S ribosomal protein L3 [Phycisphaerae bacterium]
MQALLGKKIGMTQVYDEAGVLSPVTVVQAGPCNVLQIKTVEQDGYPALQLGFEDVKVQRAAKPQIKVAAKAKCKPKRFVREVRLAQDAQDVELGQTFSVDVFEGVDLVDVIGTTKGKGYQGVMKRHNFGGQPASHGTERKHRSPGSIGSHATTRGWGGDIKKGKRMAGHMGSVRSTSRNHRLVRIDKENNLLLIQGAVPGANGGYVFIRASKTGKAAQ